jgi:hypothetical protein
MALYNDHDFEIARDPIKNARTSDIVHNKFSISKKGSEKHPFDIVSGSYKIIMHRDVVGAIETKLLPYLPFKVIKETERIYDNGGIMDYRFLTDNDFTVGTEKLHLVISAVNSYNRMTPAGYSVLFETDNGTSMYSETGKYVRVLNTSKHIRGGKDIDTTSYVIDMVTSLIATTITKWKEWDSVYLTDVVWVRKFVQLFYQKMADKIMNIITGRGQISIFQIYKIICETYLGSETMEKRGFSYMNTVSTFVNYISNPNILSFDLTELDTFLSKKSIFTWEEREKPRTRKKRKSKDLGVNEIPEETPESTEESKEDEELIIKDKIIVANNSNDDIIEPEVEADDEVSADIRDVIKMLSGI